MESIWTSQWMAYRRHHSIGIPYGFHSGHGVKNWLSCQPKNAPCPVHGMRLESMESIWKIAGSVKTSLPGAEQKSEPIQRSSLPPCNSCQGRVDFRGRMAILNC